MLKLRLYNWRGATEYENLLTVVRVGFVNIMNLQTCFTQDSKILQNMDCMSVHKT